MTGKLAEAIDEQVNRAVAVLKKGGVIAFPTDTVYGIGADIRNKDALKRIFEIKSRPAQKPLQVFLSDLKDFATVAREIPPIAWQLAEAFLPGGLTLILKKQPWVPDVVTAGGDTIAVRLPDHPVPLALVDLLGNPIAATSANLSGQPAGTTSDEVERQLGDTVGFIIEGGRCPNARESTILDLTQERPRILREGAVAREAIEKVMGQVAD